MPFRISWKAVRVMLRTVGDPHKMLTPNWHAILSYRFWENVKLVCRHCKTTQAREVTLEATVKGEARPRLDAPCWGCGQPCEEMEWAEAAIAAYRLKGYEGLRALFHEGPPWLENES